MNLNKESIYPISIVDGLRQPTELESDRLTRETELSMDNASILSMN